MLNREFDPMKDGTPRELALGHSLFDQLFPVALHEMERVKLSIGEKWKDRVEEKVSEYNRQSLSIYTFILVICSLF
jgi:hypothetical protein